MYSGQKLSVLNINAIMAPIGTIIAFDKTFTGVPTLPAGWLECDGSVISDAESPINGQTLPDLNGDNRFLRGNTMSATTGGDTHTHTGTTGYPSVQSSNAKVGTFANADAYHVHTFTTASATLEPPYYNVVFIMRVK